MAVLYDEAYVKGSILRKTEDGYSIECIKGLWRVDAPTQAEAEREARHYFAQYFGDGEYADRLT